MKILTQEILKNKDDVVKSFVVVESTSREKTRSKKVQIIESPVGLSFGSTKNKLVKVLFSSEYHFASKSQKQKQGAYDAVNEELNNYGLCIRI